MAHFIKLFSIFYFDFLQKLLINCWNWICLFKKFGGNLKHLENINVALVNNYFYFLRQSSETFHNFWIIEYYHYYSGLLPDYL